MANIKIPYSLTAAVDVSVRREFVKSAIARGLRRIDRRPLDETKTLYVACFGPSLRDTYEELRGKSPIIACSGATKFLASKGIITTWHIEMDPREHKAVTSLPPVAGVQYLIASCCSPKYFDQLVDGGADIVLWHTVNSNWDDEMKFIEQVDPGQLVISTGSTIGLGAIQVGGILGFNRFEIHGMDGSFASDGNRHAGSHAGKVQHDVGYTWAAGGVKYHTTQIMANAVAETINTAKNFPIFTIWHGDGLTQALIRESNLMNACCADEIEKRAKLQTLRTKIVHTPVMSSKTKATFWDSLLAFLTPADLPELVRNISICEPRRTKARYNTGTIPFESAVYLRALCRFYQPEVVMEIGTFIGTSTLALQAKRVVYTCDKSNDCVPSDYERVPNIITFPYASSTTALMEIQEPVDLFFFDGRIQPTDLVHIQRLSKPTTVYVFDDYTGHEKGVVNAALINGFCAQGHTLVFQPKGPSTLAALIPFHQKVAS